MAAGSVPQPLRSLEAPASLQELLQWPCRVLVALKGVSENACGVAADEVDFNRLAMSFQRGVFISTSYSGLGAAELSLQFLQQQLRANGDLNADALGVVNTQACDVKPSAQQVLLNSGSASANHIFADLNDKVPSTARAVLDKYEALAAATDDVSQKAQAFQDMRDFLLSLESENALFPARRKAHCVKHGRRCLLRDPDCPSQRPGALTIEIAGTICKDVSQMHRGRVVVVGPSGRILLIWLMERRHRREQIILAECTPQFPEAILREMLGMLYQVHSHVCGPEDLGWWVRRRWRFTLMVLRQEFGGKFSFASSWGSFQRIFYKSPSKDSLKCDSFFAAPKACVDHVLRCKARRLGINVADEGQGPPPSWDEVLLASQQSMWRDLQIRALLHKKFGVSEEEILALDPSEFKSLLNKLCRQFDMRAVWNLEMNDTWTQGHNSNAT